MSNFQTSSHELVENLELQYEPVGVTVYDVCHLMMGVPGSTLETTCRHILDMAKPIVMLKNARFGT